MPVYPGAPRPDPVLPMAVQVLGEDLQKAAAVLVVEEYRRAAVTTGGYVVDDVKGTDAKWTGHPKPAREA